MKNRFFIYIMLVFSCVFLSACGLSKENQQKLTDAKNELTAQKAFAEEIYGKLTTDSFEKELSDLAGKYDELKELDTSKISDKQIDEYLTRYNDLTASYKEIFDQMDAELKSEEAAVNEANKHIEIPCRIENNSGSEISSITFKDVSLSSETENYLSEGLTLPSGRTLEGVVLPIYTDSTSWSLSVTDTLGNVTEYSLALGDVNSASENGISIILSSPENGAEISSYVPSEG